MRVCDLPCFYLRGLGEQTVRIFRDALLSFDRIVEGLADAQGTAADGLDALPPGSMHRRRHDSAAAGSAAIALGSPLAHVCVEANQCPVRQRPLGPDGASHSWLFAPRARG